MIRVMILALKDRNKQLVVITIMITAVFIYRDYERKLSRSRYGSHRFNGRNNRSNENKKHEKKAGDYSTRQKEHGSHRFSSEHGNNT